MTHLSLQNVLDHPVPKLFKNGTHRTVSPDITIQRVKPHWQRMGITRVANVTGLDRIGIPVIMVCRPNSRSLAVSQGKGLFMEAAIASGLMEAAELYHAEYIHLPLMYASYSELQETFSLANIGDLPSIKNSRYHDALPLLWIEGNDVLGLKSVWLPFECVHVSARQPGPAGSGCFLSTSNGLASGNHLIEALLHGICEVVERDATALWECLAPEERMQTRIRLDTVDCDHCCTVVQRLRQAHIDVAVWETTSDVGLPSFLCEIHDRNGDVTKRIEAYIGMGCHVTRNIALLRALTEAVQCRLTLISGARDDLFRREYGLEDTEGTEGTPISVRYPLLWAEAPQKRFADCPTFDGATFNEDVEWAIRRLKASGLEQVIAINLTKPEIGIPVVRTVIPGLEGPDDAPDYVPGARALAVAQRTKQ